MWKNKLRGIVALLVLAGGLLIAAPQPARAIDVVTDPGVTGFISTLESSTIAQFGLQVAQWYQQNVQTAMASVANQVAQWMRANLEIQMTDTINADARQNVNAAAAAAIAGNMAQPKGYSACRVAQGSIARSEVSTGRAAVGGAMTQAGADRDATSYTADMKAEIADGLAPCSTANDNDTSNYKALKCDTAAPSWSPKYERADQTPDALFGSYASDTKEGTPYELLVPPGFTLTNGVYQPIPIVHDVQYMPFVAAYSYCQRINPRRGRLAPMNPSQPTVNALAAGGKNDADAAMNSAYSLCMNLLAERMQYGAGGSTNAMFANLSQSQKTACTADFNRHWFGDNANTGASVLSTNSKCQADGRSELQAKFDLANRDQYLEYHSQYLNGLERETIALLEANTQKEKSDFDSYILNERTALAKAIADSHNMTSVNIDPALAQPVR